MIYKKTTGPVRTGKSIVVSKPNSVYSSIYGVKNSVGNIIVTGAVRTGKSTLSNKISRELNYAVIGLDGLVATFQQAYPQLDIRLNWDREKTSENLAPFLGHYLGASCLNNKTETSPCDDGGVEQDRFVMEGAYFNFDKMLPILQTYGIQQLSDNFILIGLVQNNKTVEQLVSDFKKYDTPHDWTYNFSDDDLRDVAQDIVSSSQFMTENLMKYGFTIYDVSEQREQVFDNIVQDLRTKLA